MHLHDMPGKEKVEQYPTKAPKKPLVSVSIITYNHENFIRQCLDSVLSQKTDFEYEILLGEDDSTDKTRVICKEYADKYPDKIRLFLHDRSNVITIGGKPSGRYNMLYNFAEARGKYLALCEGDDYWTDPHKLQRQVDFMDKHPDYALCFHPVNVVFEDGHKKDEVFPAETTGFTVQKLLERNYIQTNSVMYRRQKNYDMVVDVMPGDWYFHLYHAQFGKIGFINKVMSTYRRHPGGIWNDSNNASNMFWQKYGIPHLYLYDEFLKMYGSRVTHRNIVLKNAMDILLEVKKVLNADELALGMQKSTKLSIELILWLSNDIRKQQTIAHELQKSIEELQSQIVDIKSSRLWKLRNTVAKIRGKTPL